MTPALLLVTVPALTLTPPLLWYLLRHIPAERRRRQARVEALRWIARNMDAPSMRGMVFSIDDAGRINMEPRR